MKIRNLAVLGLVLALAGCYHVTVETGKPASNTVINDPWAMAFVGGLIPPDVVNVSSQCRNGVSRVESQLSFLNMLVSGITGSIITPMTITVTCAAGGMEEEDLDDAEVIDAQSSSFDDLARALNRAAVQSWHEMGSPVYVAVPVD